MSLLNDIQKHAAEYLILFVGLFTFIILFFLFQYDYVIQTVIAAIGSVFYTLWGLFHHHRDRGLSLFIVLEYILFSTISFLVLYFVIWF